MSDTYKKGLIQSIDFVLSLKCKTCDNIIYIQDYSKLTTHKDGSISLRFNDFHSVVCSECSI